MTSCSCRTPCPCRSNLPPAPQPFCESSDFAQVDSGSYGGVALDGARFALVQRGFTPDGWRVLYLDRLMPEVQREGILGLLEEMGYDAFSAVRLVPMRFSTSQDGYEFDVFIPGVLTMRSRRRLGPDGRPEPSVPAIDMWTQRISYAQDVVHRLNDSGLGKRWDWSGRQSNHKIFELNSEGYLRCQIGWRHYTGKGEFQPQTKDCH